MVGDGGGRGRGGGSVVLSDEVCSVWAVTSVTFHKLMSVLMFISISE